MDSEIVAAACGSCGEVVAAHYAPDFCGNCRARYDKGDPLALVWMHMRSRGPGLTFSHHVDFRGPWPASLREVVAPRLLEMMGDHDSTESQTTATPNQRAPGTT